MDINTKKAILNSVATKTGNIKATLESLKIPYDQYRELEQIDHHFSSEIKLAERFFVDGLNGLIYNLSKHKLLKTLQEGITEIKTVTESKADGDGNIIEQNTSITKVYKGVPMSAIKMGLEIVPQFTKAVESMLQNNALSPEKAAQILDYVGTFEDGLRTIINGEEQTKELTPELVSGLQRMIVGE